MLLYNSLNLYRVEGTLNDRKQQLVAECLERYSPKTRKWWQGRADNIYMSTWDIYKEKNYPQVFVDEISIGKSRPEAFLTLFICLLMAVLFIVLSFESGNIYFQLAAFIAAAALVFISVRNLLDRKPKIILNKDGLWTAKWRFTIPWRDIVVSCIREDSRSEHTGNHLRIHFYDPYEDVFKMVETEVDGMEKEPSTIACFVQQFRLQYGKEMAGQ
jgi:hypothetical protein